MTTNYEFSITRAMEREIDIKAMRAELGLTQAALAVEVGVDQSTVSNWENGTTKPRGPARKLLQSIADRRHDLPKPAAVEARP
ncbi:helix-turn-helix domain-containing protein [Aminobacter sp. NyZ550]|uniref:helix-turn-helix domain-containing protein n=1 Tax=Aminobacter sp. NyZ550 TaxID=2979870 RepID=UPI0021D5A021|nr:helix-turn-helix domain-containing protein [Aminobacter sp. NyZ550]WAX93167.1 helix-turn-helix domain-containing protein [Aminobacter sp. NyZ550]